MSFLESNLSKSDAELRAIYWSSKITNLGGSNLAGVSVEKSGFKTFGVKLDVYVSNDDKEFKAFWKRFRG
jgi:hypothetical protein